MLTALSEGTTARGGNVRRRGEQVVVAGDVSMCERLARAWWRGGPTRSASSPPWPTLSRTGYVLVSYAYTSKPLVPLTCPYSTLCWQ